MFLDNIVDNYSELLKKRYNTTYVSESRWPPFTPAKFTKLGYIIHKPKRTAKDAKKSAILARSGSLLSENVAIEEEISNIFLPSNNDKRQQVILIEGAPGIGKTMLMREIGRLWATEQILKDKKVLYFLSLRDPKISEMKCTEDMFLYSCKNRNHARICNTYFGNNGGQGLAILLDGLDENPQTIQSGSFLHKTLIEEKIFIDACIVITSRPHATIDLLKHVSYRVEIIGFTDERRQEFVEENLKANSTDLKNYLHKHEIIDTLCYIPLNMTIVLFLFNEKIELEDLPKTQTELTQKAVRMTVFHNLQKLGITESKNDLGNLPTPYNEIFYYLSELAYNALGEKKLTFTRDEIKKACPVPVNDNEIIERAVTNGLGLIQTAQFLANADGDTESVSNFAHYSVQELVAAWYIAFSHRSFFQRFPFTCNLQNGSQKCLQIWFQLKVLKVNFWKGDFINMWSFYIGLTKGEDFAFKHFLSGNALFSYIQCKCFSWLKHVFSNVNNEIVEHIEVEQRTISTRILENKIKTLLLYFLLQEAPGNNMVKCLDTVVTDKKLDVSKQSLVSKQDLFLLSYILSRPYLTKQWESVNLSHCEIDDEIFEDLHDVLTRNDGRPKPDIKDLSLSGNKLKLCSNAIANLVCCQKVLHLDLSNNVLEDLIPFERYRCGDFLETLHVSNNKLGNEKASQSLTALKFLRKLKALTLSHNDIKGGQSVNDAIGLALCSCNSLEELKLDGNIGEFENKAMLLFTVINEVRNSESDEHYYNGESDKASAFLKVLHYCKQIDYQPDSCVLRNKLIQSKIVDISCNGLETDAGICLGQHLYLLVNLKMLDITKNNISDEATKSLTIGMFLTPNLEEFKYDENLFNEKSCMIFEMIQTLRTTIHRPFKCEPSEIKALLFILNCIDNVEELQSSDIVCNVSLVSELSLSHTLGYKLTSEDLKELCNLLTWFEHLKVLDVRNNEITNEAKESLAKVMLQISTLNTVKLIGNPIFDDELSMAVFDTIKNVREKQVESIIDYQKCSSHIQCYSVIYVMKCLNKLKDPNCFKSFDNIITLDVDLESDYAGKFFEYLNFLPFLKNLKINNVTCVTDYGMNQLGKYLSQNITLTTLDLSFCNLENLKIKNMAVINNSLKFLKCNYSKITNELLRNFILMFRNVDHLEIEGNCLGDKGIGTLHSVLLSYQQTLHSLVYLNIANNNISDKSTRNLTVEILLAAKLEEFKYNENLFSENNTMIFEMIHELHTTINKSFKCEPSKVKALLFILNCINDNVEELQSSDVVSIISGVTELNLSHNELTTLDYKLTSEDLKGLCALLTWFKRLEVLDVRNNDITDEAKEAMVKAVLQMNTLIDLKLIGNPIFHNMLVFDTIIKLREGRVQSITYNLNSSSHEHEGYCVIYIMECLNLLENMNCHNIFDNITTLDVDSKSEFAGKIFECLNYLLFLREMTINNVTCITDYGMNQLGKYLTQNITLTTLDLSFCNLQNLQIKNVARTNNSLKFLKCNYSKITNELLRNFMLMFRNVDHLEIEGNCLGDKEISNLHSVLYEKDQQMLSTSMTTLKLANNQITSSSVVRIIEIVQKYKVKYLDVSRNRLTNFPCSEKHTVTTLEELHISWNGLEMDKSFIRILQNCTQLVILDLENNNITNDTFEHLATGYLFTTTLTLENLRLNGNPCRDNPKNEAVLKMVEKCHLKSDYKYFKCPPAEFSVFLTILELVDSVKNISSNMPKIVSCIKSLDISYSEPSDSCNQQNRNTNQISLKLRSSNIKSFCKYLSYFESLDSINMMDNNIEDEDVIDDLSIAVLKNSSITEVWLEGNPIHKIKKCYILFDTIKKMRSCGGSDAVIDHPETLEGLINILKYINTFEDKSCDITENIEHLDISQCYQSPDRNSRSRLLGFEKIDNLEKISTDLVIHLSLFRKLKTLNLSHAYVTSGALQELSTFLCKNETLQQLDISSNGIQAEGALIILKSLLNTNTTLKKLNLNKNKITGEKKCKEIAYTIHSLRKKVTVDIADNKLTEESKRMLAIK